MYKKYTGDVLQLWDGDVCIFSYDVPPQGVHIMLAVYHVIRDHVIVGENRTPLPRRQEFFFNVINCLVINTHIHNKRN